MIKPLKNKLLIAEVKRTTKSESGIYLESSASASETKTGLVLAIGPDVTEVAVQDEVVLDWSKGRVVKVDGVQRVVISQDDILAVLEK